MPERSLPPDSLRAASTEITRALDARTVTAEALDTASRVVAEALLDQAEHRAPTASQSVVDGAVAVAKIDLSTVALPSGRPLEILRGGPRNVSERSLVAALLARHVHNTLQRRDGVSALRAMLPSLDWLEFVGQYPPYTAARFTLDDASAQRVRDVTAAAPVEAKNPSASA